MHLFNIFSLVADVPDFKPVFDFPGSGLLVKLLDVALAFIVVLMVYNIFASLAQHANAARSGRHHEGSVGAGVGTSVAVLVLVFAGAAFLNGWIKYLIP